MASLCPRDAQLLRATYEGSDDLAGGGPVIERAPAQSTELADYFRTWGRENRLRAELLRWRQTDAAARMPGKLRARAAHYGASISSSAEASRRFRGLARQALTF